MSNNISNNVNRNVDDAGQKKIDEKKDLFEKELKSENFTKGSMSDPLVKKQSLVKNIIDKLMPMQAEIKSKLEKCSDNIKNQNLSTDQFSQLQLTEKETSSLKNAMNYEQNSINEIATDTKNQQVNASEINQDSIKNLSPNTDIKELISQFDQLNEQLLTISDKQEFYQQEYTQITNQLEDQNSDYKSDLEENIELKMGDASADSGEEEE